MFDLAILHGKVYINNEFKKLNIYIKDGKVSTLSNELLFTKEKYNAENLYILPGFIDPHVHFELTVGNHTSIDTFESGSISAAYGGVTTFIDFLDPINDVETLNKVFDIRNTLAKKSIIDYSFHTTIFNPKSSPIDLIKKSKTLGIPSIKLFTTYGERQTYDSYIYELLKASSTEKINVMIHSENDALIKKGRSIISEHAKTRPEISEITEIIKLSQMAEYTNGRLYIVHTTCGTSIEKVKQSYSKILNKTLFIESCPHYFYFNSEIYSSNKGNLYTMTPPLRNKNEVEKLKQNIDNIYTIGTDHCPFTLKEKMTSFTDLIPMGVGSIEHSFVLMYSMFGEKIINKFTINPAKVHGLYPKKGTLLPGSDADIVIFNPNEESIIKNSHSLCEYEIYQGIKVKGKIISVLSNGKFVIKENKVFKTKGRFIERKIL